MDDAPTYSIVFVDAAIDHPVMPFAEVLCLGLLVDYFSFLRYLQVLMERCRSSSGCWPPILNICRLII